MRNSFRKIIALLLVFVLMFAYTPAVFAEEGEGVTEGDYTYTIVTPDEGDAYAELVKYTGDADSVTIPASFGGATLKVIGHEAFFGAKMKSVTIPEGVEVLDSRSFSSCKNLVSVIFPDSVKTIGDYAFEGCYNKEDVKDSETGEITDTVETGLTFVRFPEALETIGDGAFFGCELFTGNGTVQSNVEGKDDAPALLLPLTVKSIGSDAFSQCRSLVNVVIPEGVTDVMTGTFTDCAGLERVEIPSTVTHIGAAFNGAFTSHSNVSENQPILYIKAPHAVIVDSPSMDPHVVVYGARHSSVQAYVDKINADREDSFYKDYSDFTGIELEIDLMEFVEIEVPGHDFVGTVTVPGCLTRGYTTYICQQCQEKGLYDDEALADTYVPHICEYTLPLGHDYGEWSEALKPGCETNGSKYRLCKRELTDEAGNILHDADGNALVCGYRDNRMVPPAGHEFILKNTTTCTSEGRSWKECIVCGIKRDMQPHAAYGHFFVESVLTELVECGNEDELDPVDGKFTRSCALCGFVDTTADGNPIFTQPAHPDANNDHYCDVCDEYIGSSDLSPEKNCTCDCHSQFGIVAIFYKLKLFFWQLFGTNKTCACGVAHYRDSILHF